MIWVISSTVKFILLIFCLPWAMPKPSLLLQAYNKKEKHNLLDFLIKLLSTLAFSRCFKGNFIALQPTLLKKALSEKGRNPSNYVTINVVKH